MVIVVLAIRPLAAFPAGATARLSTDEPKILA